ncbi:MAG: 30S ribosomal protein S12 methylthiotransferase RimO [Oscillospiraceae bacterium]
MKIAIISLGCPKNQVDADVFCHALLKRGHTTVPTLEQADCIIINTCGFIESAKAESIENILTACSVKKENKKIKVVVTGCLAERYRDELAKEIPEVDAVVGIGCNADLCDIIDKLGDEQLQCYNEKSLLPLGGKRIISTPSHYAYLKISEGCNNRCHYCAIPLIRGGLRSRDMAEIIAEANWLVSEGVKEIILVAQDITAYGDDTGVNMSAQLLRELNKVKGLKWLRLLYAYPEKITDEFIAAIAECDKILPYLDVPIQHINSEVLKNMNRKGDKNTVLNALDRLRKAMPNIVLRTTLITGYPGETEQQFLELCDFVKLYKFDRLGCFAYSQEEDTVAATMPNQVDEDVREQRAEIIMRIQAEIMAKKQSDKVGQKLEVICDGFDTDENLYICRTAADAPDIDTLCYVKSETPLVTGEFYTCTVDESDEYDLFATIY